jgi:hypothetical protein
MLWDFQRGTQNITSPVEASYVDTKGELTVEVNGVVASVALPGTVGGGVGL